MFRNTISTGLRMLALLTLLTGVLYPLVVTIIAQAFFADQANGSLLLRDSQVIGSDLIGQQTDDPRYFWGRPSAVDTMQGSTPDHLGTSGATNYGWTSAALAELVAQRAAEFRQANGLSADTVVPADMLFASGSGLDPHISPESARLQIDRVADARGLPRQQVANLVERFVEAPQFGFLGQPRVNVLRVNLALDALQ
ncbi:MAG: potassium-transporting ATPase subunit KdpC [Anaerolineae bacterium]|nr:potassium-transporting ATPase subunit KdpC [Anaerolineae bacterium]